MGRVVQRVDPAQLARVLEGTARAAIAIDRNGTVEALPALYRRCGDQHRVGVARDALPDSAWFERAVLVLDDGAYWFELRAVTWRGRIEPAPADAANGADAVVWFVFDPIGAIAWDYGALHEDAEA